MIHLLATKLATKDVPTPMIELAILGLLDDDDLHGYELRKRLTDLLGMHLAISFGSLYPALGRLERAGCVKAVTTRASGDLPIAPMSGSLTGELAAFKRQRQSRGETGETGATGPARAGGGRARKVYGITDTGRERLQALLVDPDFSDDRTFAVRVAFCHHLTPSQRLDLFAGRRAELVRRRDQRRTAARSPERVNDYLRSLLERDIDSITADLAWLDGLIDLERGGATTPDRRTTPTSTDTGGSR
jgi:DNA-binding PadR family transcriptional regulator